MKNKKVLALCMAALLAIGVAGCGGGSSSSGGNAETTEPAAEAKTDENSGGGKKPLTKFMN